MFEEFDKHVSILSESFARRFNRRKVISGTIKGVFASMAAASIGQLTNLGQAFAQFCTCDEGWTQGHPCNYWGYPCPSNGCPSGMKVCYKPSCGGWCDYSNGHWVSCSGLGPNHKGYRLCWDCTNRNNPCHPKCSCLSTCIGC